MDQDKQDEIVSKLAGRGIDYYKMKIADGYSFFHDKISDPYFDSSKYLYKVSHILDGAVTPENVNEKYKSYNKSA